MNKYVRKPRVMLLYRLSKHIPENLSQNCLVLENYFYMKVKFYRQVHYYLSDPGPPGLQNFCQKILRKYYGWKVENLQDIVLKGTIVSILDRNRHFLIGILLLGYAIES